MEHEHSPHDDILVRTKHTPRSVTREGREQGARTALGAADPGHQVDSTESNTYRALRFVDRAPGGRGNKLYAEFTRLNDYNFTADDVFVEIFDLDADPGQLVNLANVTG